MNKEYLILGYGAGPVLYNNGVVMGTAKDLGYAKDLTDAMIKKHIGQWFGWFSPECQYSDPQRMTLVSYKEHCAAIASSKTRIT